MARIMICSCQKCGYYYKYLIGTGFSFPEIYQETVKNIKNNLLGDDIQKFLEEHPDGAIDVQKVLLQCMQCGTLDNRLSLSMYVPKNGYKRIKRPDQIWSTAALYKGYDYISPHDIFSHYTLFQTYNHKCKSCGGTMKIVDDEYGEMLHWKKVLDTKTSIPPERINIKCPSCGSVIESMECGNWD